MKRPLLLLFFIAGTAFAQPKSDSWDAGRVDRYDPGSNNGLHRASLQVINRCCKGEHQFEVSTTTPWIVIAPGDSQFTLSDGAIRMVNPGLDARALPIGTHEGTISVLCTTCEAGACSYVVNVRLNVTEKVGTGVYVSSQPRGSTPPCPDPPERVKANAVARHCTFTGSYGPEVSLEPCGATRRGQHSTPELESLLGDMAKAISVASAAKSAFDLSGTLRQPDLPSGTDAVSGGVTAGGGKATEAATGHEIDIPTSAAEVPTALASNMLNAGQEIVNWAARAGNREGRMCLAMSAVVEEVQLEYDCLPWEVCEQGVWRDDGPRNVPEKFPQPFPVIRTHRRPAQEFFVINGNMGEYQQAFGQLQTWLSQIGVAEKMRRMQVFQTLGPCHACDPPAASGPGSGPAATPGSGGRSCQEILREITRVENEIFGVQADVDELRRQLQQFPGQIQQLDSQCQQEANKLEQALDDARRAVIRASDAQFEGAAAAREAAERALNQQRERCNQERQRLERDQQRTQRAIQESDALIAELQARLAALRDEYKECLGQ